MITLLRIENAGPDKRARRLVFDAEEHNRTTSSAVTRVLDLQEGASYDPRAVADDIERAEAACARERSLRVLANRERSAHELERRLCDDGYPLSLVQDIVSRMSELGLVDDERFAAAWARSRHASGIGPNRIKSELAAKGIDKDLAALAVAEATSESDLVEQARRIIASKRIETRQEREKAVNKLVRRGFSLSIALKAVEADRE